MTDKREASSHETWAEKLGHPAFARGAEQREVGLRLFTSQAARRLVRDTGVALINYRELRRAMRPGALTDRPAVAAVRS
jgi:hypothetical protein